MVAAGVFLGIVDEAELDGVDLELVGELVHGALEGGGAGGFAGGALVGGDADVHVDHAVAGDVGLRVVEEVGEAGGAFEEVLHDGGVHDDVVLDRQELAFGAGAEGDLLMRGGAAADGAEHLAAVDGELDGFAYDSRGHGGEVCVRPSEPLEPKPPPAKGPSTWTFSSGMPKVRARVMRSPTMYWVEL